MTWDQIEGSWKTVLGQARAQRGNLTDDKNHANTT